MNVYSRQQEIEDLSAKRSHVFLLGAGASYAAFPAGDKNGRRLPLMKNLIRILQLEDVLREFGISDFDQNFETLYSNNNPELRCKLEKKVSEYFTGMQLPDEPTLYDLLVISLREKDYILTFNWDPFLAQALQRNYQRVDGKVPKALYLHGNVAIGYCNQSRKYGSVGMKSPSTGKPYAPTPLLYPVHNKDYSSDPFIAGMWSEANSALKNAFMFTVFGYGAPSSDQEAIRLLKEAWGDTATRELEEVEIVDVRPEDELARVWAPFIHTHHWQYINDLNGSFLLKHPRRSIEAIWTQLIDANWTEGNPYSDVSSFSKIENHIHDLLMREG